MKSLSAMPAAFVVVLLGLLLLAPQQAEAKRGTHFIAEGAGGVGFTDTSFITGFWNASFAYGGKFKQIPILFYLMASFDHNFFDSSLSNSISEADRDTDDYALLFGLRCYFRLSKKLRLFVQGLVGPGWYRTEWVVNGLENYYAKDVGGAWKLSLGFQARMIRALSVGLAAERMMYWGKESELESAAVAGFTNQYDQGDTTRILATVTFHF